MADYYAIEVTTEPDDPESRRLAREAACRRRPRERRLSPFIPSEWRISALPSRSYVLEAPAPWWRWVTGWRP